MTIKIKLYLLLFVVIVNSVILQSQSLRIIDVDARNHPYIGVTFEFDSDTLCDFNKLQVVEKDEFCKYNVDKCFEQQQSTLTAFLIDEILFYDNNVFQIIYNLLGETSIKIKYNELANIFILRQDTSELKYKNICVGFTYNHKELLKRYDSILVSRLSYKTGTKQMFDFIKSYKAESYSLILISKTDTSNNVFKEMKALSDSFSMNLVKIKLPNLSLPQHSQLNDLKKQIASSISKNSYIDAEPKPKKYKIYYHSNQQAKVNLFYLKYKEYVAKGTYNNQMRQTQIPFEYISLFFFVTIIFLLYLLIYKKNRVISFKNKKSTLLKLNYSAKDKVKNGIDINPHLEISINDFYEKVELNKLATKIGRGQDNDILIANLTISNHHATITNEGGVFYIEDNDSTNGVLVNDVKIGKKSLKNGDIVRLGKATLKFIY